MYEELMAGFDIREMWIAYDSNWTQERKDAFLLRLDIEKPLSTDRTVWASVFRSYTLVDGVDRGTVPEGGFEIPIDHRTSYNLWNNLQEMCSYLEGKWGKHWKRSWVIAITEFIDSQEKDEAESFHDVDPVKVDTEWSFLGYDISDRSGALWSALTGSSYEADEIQSLRDTWRKHLNRYHLFDEEEPAFEFCRWADSRDRGHAPHSVYGLYRIRTRVELP